MALQVWFSIQSDFGITLGELGRLASETDSKLIASTLQALKDIVSVEASSGESQFMTGAVETSSFGTFAISSGKDAKLVMSYIISVPPNATVPENLEGIVQKLCTNFGKQLTLIKDIHKIAKDGRRISDELLYQTYLNAVTLVQLDTNYRRNERQMKKDINLLIDDVLYNSEKLSDILNIVLDDEFMMNKDNWTGGYPSNLGKYRFITGVSNHLLQDMMRTNPIGFLNSELPRMEYKNVSKILEEKFSNGGKNLEKKLIKSFEDLDESDYREYISNLSIFQLHNAADLVYKEFMKRNMAEIAKTSPEIFYINPSKARLRANITSKIPELKIPNFGDLMIETVTKHAPPHTWNLISTFYQTLVKEMIGKEFSVSAIDIGLLFAQYFIDPQELKGEIAKDKTFEKHWRDQLVQQIPPVRITSLQVNSIEEAVFLSNSAANTVINVLVDILTKYYIGGNDYQGELVNRFAAFYNEIGPKIKASSILISMLHAIQELEVSVDFVVPQPKDIVGAYMIDNKSRFRVKDVEYSVNKKFFGPYVIEDDNETYEIFSFLNDLSELTILRDDGKDVKLNVNKFNYWKLPQLFVDESIIIESMRISMERKLEMILIKKMRDFGNEFLDQIKLLRDNAIKGSIKETDILNFKLSSATFNFQDTEFGEKIHDLDLDITERIRNFSVQFVEDNISELQAKLSSGGKIKKETKTIKKIYEAMESDLENILEDYRSLVEVEITNIMNRVGKYKRQIRAEIYPNESDILHYDLNYPNLVRPIEEVEKEITNFIRNNYSDLLLNEDQLRFIIGVKLFDTISQSAFESTYDALVNNSLSTKMKSVKDASTNILEFETNLRDMGRVQAYSLFNILSEIIELCNSYYIKRDGIVSLDSDYLKLHLGKFKISKFPRKDVITNLLNLPNIQIERDGDSWLISYGFTKLTRNEGNIPKVITFRDTSLFVRKVELMDELNDIFEALKDVGRLIEEETYKRIENMSNEIFDVIFDDN